MPLHREFACLPMSVLLGIDPTRTPMELRGACLGVSISWLLDAFQGAKPWVDGDSRFFSALAMQRAASWHGPARREHRGTTSEDERFASGQASSWEVAVHDALQQRSTPARSYLADRNFLSEARQMMESTYPFIRSVSRQCKRSCVIRWPERSSELQDIIEAAVKANAGFVVNLFGSNPVTLDSLARGVRRDEHVRWGHVVACAPWADGQRRLMDPATAQYTFEFKGLLSREFTTALDCSHLINKAENCGSPPRAVCTMVFSSPGGGAPPGMTLKDPLPRPYWR